MAFIKILAAAVIFTSALFYYQYRKQKLYRKRFEALINKENETTTVKKLNHLSGAAIGISEELVEKILLNIETFEKDLKFLTSNITTNNLAAAFNTNNKYLSKIINAYKGKSFTQYINDLRIDYSITSLKADPMFRRYTIKAIAEEMGFNTAEAFSKSFYKRTGLYPSYFIKQLEKQEF